MQASPEFRLAVECCRHNFGCNISSTELIVPDSGEWSRFIRLARFHRIEGLVWNCLSRRNLEVPEEVRAAFSAAATSIAAHNLQAAAASGSLQKYFEGANVPLLFLKGLTLGALAYGNPALKSAIDIDLLIDPRDLGKAAGLLRNRGYRLAAPRASRNDRVPYAWHRMWKESVWSKEEPASQIDLHTRPADNRRLIGGISVHSPRQWLDVIDGVRLPTLADDELFAYLAVHGASSAWFRLKWISDFAGIMHGRSRTEIERLYRRSQELGAGRAAGQALLLSDELFGTLRSNVALKGELVEDSTTERLFRIALSLLAGEPREPTEKRWGTLPIHWTQVLLLPGLGYKMSELSRQAVRLLVKVAT